MKATHVVYNGQVLSLRGLAKATGIHHKTLVARYDRGDRGEHLYRKPDKRFARRGKF